VPWTRSPPAAAALPLPRCLQLVRGAAVARSILGPLDAGVSVVVAQVPEIVWADPEPAARADRERRV